VKLSERTRWQTAQSEVDDCTWIYKGCLCRSEMSSDTNEGAEQGPHDRIAGTPHEFLHWCLHRHSAPFGWGDAAFYFSEQLVCKISQSIGSIDLEVTCLPPAEIIFWM
jgi:hypothetical protein